MGRRRSSRPQRRHARPLALAHGPPERRRGGHDRSVDRPHAVLLGRCYWCPGNGKAEITTILDATGWPDYIFVGPYGGMWPLTGTYGDPYVLGNATERGVKVITILDNYNDGALGVGTDLAVRAGFLEITKRYEELATFLGATANLDSEKRALCQEVNNFKATAAAASANRCHHACGAGRSQSCRDNDLLESL